MSYSRTFFTLSAKAEFAKELDFFLRMQGVRQEEHAADRVNEVYRLIFNYCKHVVEGLLSQVRCLSVFRYILDTRAELLKTPNKEPLLELALEYCAELMLTGGDLNDDIRFPTKHIFDRYVVAARAMVEAASRSDEVYFLHSGECSIELAYNDGDYPTFIMSTDRIRRRDSFMRELAGIAEEPAPAGEVLKMYDDMLRNKFKISLSQCFAAALKMKDWCQNTSGFKVWICKEDALLSAAANNMRVDEAGLISCFEGLVLRDIGDRIVYKQNQPNRILRRPFVSVLHKGVRNLAWHPFLVERAIFMILQELSFQLIPKEWMDDETTAANRRHSLKFSKDWELHVIEKLHERGLVGGNISNCCIDGNKTPLPCGEIDALMYERSSGTIFVLECKRTRPGYGPQQYRSDYDNYIRDRRSYVHQLENKAQWIRENIPTVIEMMSVHFGSIINPAVNFFKVGVITKYPSFAQIYDDRIITLSTLLREYDSSGNWPLVHF